MFNVVASARLPSTVSTDSLWIPSGQYSSLDRIRTGLEISGQNLALFRFKDTYWCATVRIGYIRVTKNCITTHIFFQLIGSHHWCLLHECSYLSIHLISVRLRGIWKTTLGCSGIPTISCALYRWWLLVFVLVYDMTTCALSPQCHQYFVSLSMH